MRRHAVREKGHTLAIVLLALAPLHAQNKGAHLDEAGSLWVAKRSFPYLCWCVR